MPGLHKQWKNSNLEKCCFCSGLSRTHGYCPQVSSHPLLHPGTRDLFASLASFLWNSIWELLEKPCRRRQWHPTPVLLPGKFHGVVKSWTRLSDFTFTFHFHVLEKEMATHSSVLAWRIPGTGEPGGLPFMGSHGVGHDWSDLAAAEKPRNVSNCLKSTWFN